MTEHIIKKEYIVPLRYTVDFHDGDEMYEDEEVVIEEYQSERYYCTCGMKFGGESHARHHDRKYNGDDEGE